MWSNDLDGNRAPTNWFKNCNHHFFLRANIYIYYHHRWAVTVAACAHQNEEPWNHKIKEKKRTVSSEFVKCNKFETNTSFNTYLPKRIAFSKSVSLFLLFAPIMIIRVVFGGKLVSIVFDWLYVSKWVELFRKSRVFFIYQESLTHILWNLKFQ
jgi:hypothetical protein